jgi:hypothetical protein
VRPPTRNDTYLGDGAYVRTGSYEGEIVLYTSNGISETNCVVLGETELDALLRWLDRRCTAHDFQANPGMYDTSIRYCTKCGRAEGT